MMMRNILVTFLMIFALQAFSQDVVILNNGDEIEAKVLEIHENTIDYKRFSNISGPTYHLKKVEIFMIKYASGDKDLFNVKKTTSNQETIVKQNLSNNSAYDANIGTSNCRTQKSKGAKIFGEKAGEVFFRQDIVFYGYDFSYVKLSNKSKMGQSSKLINQYFNEWNTELNKRLGYDNLRKWMHKKSMIPGNSVFQNYLQRDMNNFVDLGNFCISYEDLQKVVKSYELNETSGIGMVINLVNFNKAREYSMAWVTFFDIKTREIMYAVLTTGQAGGGGMVGHWTNGLNEAIREVFIDVVFKKKLNNTAMIPVELRLY
jgi:hypothetical protein